MRQKIVNKDSPTGVWSNLLRFDPKEDSDLSKGRLFEIVVVCCDYPASSAPQHSFLNETGFFFIFQLWDLDTLECVRVLQTSGGSVYSLAVTKEYIVCGTYENQVQVTHWKQFPKIAGVEEPKPKFSFDHSQRTQIIRCVAALWATLSVGKRVREDHDRFWYDFWLAEKVARVFLHQS